MNQKDWTASQNEDAGCAGTFVAYAGDFLKLGLALPVLFAGSQFVGFRCKASCKGDDGLVGDYYGVQEVHLLEIIRVGGINFRQLRFCLGDNAVQSLGQNFGIVDGDVADTVEVVVAHGENAGSLGCQGIIRHERRGQLVGGFLVPVRKEIAQDFFLFFRNEEYVAGPLFEPVQFCLQPFAGKFRVNRRRTGLGALVAHDQLVVRDEDGHPVQDLLKRLGPAEVGGQVFRLLVGFGDQLRPLNADLRGGIDKPFLDCFHTRCRTR